MSTLTIPPNFIGTPGSDTIQATSTTFNSIGIQVNVNGVIDTRGGNDTVSGTATDDTSYGINNDGQITLGSGNDSITGRIDTTTLIDGGNGNDYFKARRINSEGKELPNQGGAIGNVLITGGNGNDTFDVGYGNGTLDGGQGFDTLILLGSCDSYSLSGSNGELTFVRDGYTLNALNIENIIYVAEV